MWRGNQTRTSNELCDAWTDTYEADGDISDWPKVRKLIFRLEGWIRRHIRKCFWVRWHCAAGPEHALRLSRCIPDYSRRCELPIEFANPVRVA
jgi:RNA-directed DNA polymerase